MTTSSPPPQDDHVYHMILFAFRGNKRAADVLDDIKKSQKLGGYRLLVQAVVERDVQGEVSIHSSGLIVLLEDIEAEKVINELEGYQAEVVTLTIGDELSGEIDTLIAADITKTAASEAVTPVAAPDATPAATTEATPAPSA